MTTTEDKLGVVRDHRWMKAAEQRKRLEADGCRGILEFDGKVRPVTQSDLIRMSTGGRTFVFAHAFLLADPKLKQRRGGLKANFDDVVDKITARGASIKDLETGLTTDGKENRKALSAVAYDHIARSNQGLKSSLNGARSRGRPKQWGDPKNRKIIWDEWHSNAHATNTAAADEASRKMGKLISHYVMWRIVNDMREERGLRGKGASGRRPNSAAAALATTVGNPDETRPLPKARVRRGVVYFIRNGVQDRVKIGFSESHKVRMSSLQGANPEDLTLIGVIPGQAKLERKMHARFAAHRINPRREWFRAEGALAAFMKKTFPKTMKS